MSHLQRWKLKTQKLCRSPSNVFCNSSTWDIRRAFSSCSSGLISCSRLCAPELLSFVYELGSESIERPVFICSESSSMITAIYRTRWNVLFYLRAHISSWRNACCTDHCWFTKSPLPSLISTHLEDRHQPMECCHLESTWLKFFSIYFFNVKIFYGAFTILCSLDLFYFSKLVVNGTVIVTMLFDSNTIFASNEHFAFLWQHILWTMLRKYVVDGNFCLPKNSVMENSRALLINETQCSLFRLNKISI